MTDRYAVFGNPVGHSKSPIIQMSFAKTTGEDIFYDKIEAPLDGFAATAQAFRASGGKGMNITVPFKLDAYAFATKRSQAATLAGAANCIKFTDDEIYAENFDGSGLVTDIQKNFNRPFAGKKVLILGAGGSTRGLILPFLEAKAGSITVANRSQPRAEELKQHFTGIGTFEITDYESLGKQNFDIVINATSASLSGEMPNITGHIFGKHCLAYELAYGKGLTPFLRLARESNATIADGVGMLAEQAAESFHWWRGIRPDTKDVIKAITVPLVKSILRLEKYSRV